MAEEVYEGAIGIDLGSQSAPAYWWCSQTDLVIGTTYSCVANYEGTNVEISMCSMMDRPSDASSRCLTRLNSY